jgi:hypothetical protein
MRVSLQHDASDPTVSVRHDAVSHATLTHDDMASASKRGKRNSDRPVQELVWILISLLLLLYLATSYVFWAKTEFAWPIFRGF